MNSEVLGELTWKSAAEKWARGEIVWSAELGGIGPGYEQAIQVLLFEIMLRWEGELPPALNDQYPSAYEAHVDKVVHELNESCGGFSGAQVGAAKSTAYQFMRYGYRHQMEKLEDSRWIQVSKLYPKAPEAVVTGSFDEKVA